MPTTQPGSDQEGLTDEARASFADLFAETGTEREAETEDGGDWYGEHDAADAAGINGSSTVGGSGSRLGYCPPWGPGLRMLKEGSDIENC